MRRNPHIVYLVLMCMLTVGVWSLGAMFLAGVPGNWDTYVWFLVCAQVGLLAGWKAGKGGMR